MHIRLSPSGDEIGAAGSPGAILQWNDTTGVWDVTGAPGDGEIPVWDAGTNTWIFVALPAAGQEGFDFVFDDLSDVAAAYPPAGGRYVAVEGGASVKALITLDMPIEVGGLIIVDWYGMGEAGFIAPAGDAAVLMATFFAPILRARSLRLEASALGFAIAADTDTAQADVILADCRIGYSTATGTGIFSTALDSFNCLIENTFFEGGGGDDFAISAEAGFWQLTNCRWGQGHWWDFGAELSSIEVVINNALCFASLPDAAVLPLARSAQGIFQISNWDAIYYASSIAYVPFAFYAGGRGSPADSSGYLFENVTLRAALNTVAVAMHVEGAVSVRNLQSIGFGVAIDASAPAVSEFQNFDGIRAVDGAIAAVTGVTAATARVNMRR